MRYTILNSDKNFIIDYILSYYEKDKQDSIRQKLETKRVPELKQILQKHLNKKQVS